MARCGTRSLATVLVSCFTVACGDDTGPAPGGETDPGETLFSESPPMWFDAYFSWLQVSADGERAVFDFTRLIDLGTGNELETAHGLDVAFRARFDRDGLIVGGQLGDEEGWFRPEADGAGPPVRDATLPASFVFEPSPSGDRIAYLRRGTTLIIADRAEAGGAMTDPKEAPLPGSAAGLAWLPDGTRVAVYTMDDAGIGSLHLVDPTAGDVVTVARDLDGPSRSTGLSVSDDGRVVYLELAGPDAPMPDERHVPFADRDLDIWEVDLASGELRPVVQAPGEQLSPRVVDGALHWVSIETRSEVALIPMPDSPDERGPASGVGASRAPRIVASGAQLGTWRPDGRALGITIGDWRLADWALNLDGAVVEIDEEGQPEGDASVVIAGYHEDFSPVWSPDGTWIAYHSHRSDSPVAGYSAEGSSDDIYLRRADDPNAEELRLTDFGLEVGNPDWSPDGRRIVMDSWNEGGGSSTWVLEIDPATGALLDRTRVPQPGDAIGRPAWAAWSPVRDEIAITFADFENSELWVMAPDGSDARRLAGWEGGLYGGLDWTADGEAVVYAAPVDGRYRLYGVARGGG